MVANLFFRKQIILFSALILGACSSYNHLTIGITEPAPVDSPNEIKKVGIINRSIPNENSKTIFDGMDKVLSLEGKMLDSLGAARAVTGLYDGLAGFERFDLVKIIKNDQIQGSTMSVFPAPIPWEQITELCQINGVDAIFELSYFDTDAQLLFDAVPVTVNGPLGTSATVIEQQLTMTTIIKTGWRIYEPATKTIRDEFIINEQQVSSGRGINPLIAFQTITGRKEAVLQISSDMGHNYGLRIMPYYIRVSRIYFVRGTDNFKIAKRRAQVGDWHGAAELWEKELENPKRKVAGRACFNMAIINEIDGNLNDAVIWASKSYTDYKNKKALDYLNILNYRISQNQRLQEQKGE